MRLSGSVWADVRALPRPAWVLFGGTFINRFGSFVITFLVLYLTKRGYSATEAGVALSLYGVGSIGANLVGGHLADRLGRRNTIALSMFSSAATMLLLSQANALAQILPLTALAGFTAEFYRPAASALIADLTPQGERLTAFAVYRLAVNAGVAAGPAVAGILAEHSFFYLFAGDALTSAVYGVIALRLLPREPRRAPHADGRVVAAVRVMAHDRVFLKLLLVSFLSSLVFQQGYSTLPLHVQATGHSSAFYGAMMSVNGTMIIALELSLTAFTRTLAPRRAMALGLLLTGAGFAATGLASSAPALIATVVVWTFGEMCFSPVAAAYVADLAPPRLRGRYQGAFAMTFSVGLVIAPIIGTALLDVDAALLWGGCFVVGLVGAMMSVRTGKTMRTNAAIEAKATIETKTTIETNGAIAAMTTMEANGTKGTPTAIGAATAAEAKRTTSAS